MNTRALASRVAPGLLFGTASGLACLALLVLAYGGSGRLAGELGALAALGFLGVVPCTAYVQQDRRARVLVASALLLSLTGLAVALVASVR